MFLGFCLSVVSLLLSPLILTLLRRDWRKRAFFYLPLLLVLNVGFSGVFFTILHRWVPVGLLKFTLALSFTSVASFLVAFFTLRHVEVKRILPGKALLFTFGLAFILCLDVAVILARNGWSLTPGESYFRPPVHSDNQRNAVVISALARGDGSPYLANSPFAYQLFWHHLFGGLVFPLDGFTHFPFASGATVATAFLSFFLLLWSGLMMRPSLFRGWWPGILAICLIFFHADLFHFMGQLIHEGSLGIEADWSAPSGFFRNFSLKLAALTSPQHLLSLAFLSTFVVFRRTSRVLSSAAAVFSFVASPIVFIMGIPLWFAKEALRRRYISRALILEGGAIVLGAYLAYGGIFGESVVSVLSRPGISELVFFSRDWRSWALFPLSLVASTGVLGALISVRVLRLGHRVIPLLVGILVFGYLLDETEIRRHFAAVAAWYAASLLPSALPTRLEWRGAVFFTVAALFAFYLHGYFLYSYTLKPSKLDSQIAWNDYFRMNDRLKHEFPGVAVLAAADPWTIGLEMPIAMEVATSFSLPGHAAIHSRLDDEKLDLLYRAWTSHNILPYAERLGYRYVLWGPVEERTWGAALRERFVGEEPPIASSGSVKLFKLSDRLLMRFVRLVALESAHSRTP